MNRSNIRRRIEALERIIPPTIEAVIGFITTHRGRPGLIGLICQRFDITVDDLRIVVDLAKQELHRRRGHAAVSKS